MRKELVLFATIAAVFAFMTYSARAMPAAPLKGVYSSGHVVQVSGGCGPRRHRGPLGHCHPGP
jgi:hypothetical protein